MATSSRPARKPQFSPILVSEQNGIRYLHFGTEWIQGAMRVDDPYALELEFSQKMVAWMLFNDNPKTIGHLGLGAGALAKFGYHFFPESVTTAVDINPEVISVCYSLFGVPRNDPRMEVIEADAMDFVTDKSNFNRFDILHVDLYDAEARGPVLDTPEFYGSCRMCLTGNGIMSVNLFGEHGSFAPNIEAIKSVFDTVICLSPAKAGNVAVLAFKRKPTFDLERFKAKEKEVAAKTGVPTRRWVKDIRRELTGEDSFFF